MDSDYFISIMDVGAEFGIELSSEQQKIISNLEKILHNNLRDDYGLLCNLHNLYQSVNKINLPLGNLSNSDCLFIGEKTSKRMRLTELLGQKFGLSEKTIYNYLQISGRFIDFLAGEKFIIPELKDYTISKLQELLPVSNEVIRNAFAEKVLTYKSTKAEIRAFVKSCKGVTAKKVVDEQPAEEPHDPDSEMVVSIAVPADIYDHVRDLVVKHKKYASFEEYVLALIRKDMR